eukprot:COSAG05_NODE_765_length_7475_cov_6.478986_2_plen_210_part_00
MVEWLRRRGLSCASSTTTTTAGTVTTGAECASNNSGTGSSITTQTDSQEDEAAAEAERKPDAVPEPEAAQTTVVCVAGTVAVPDPKSAVVRHKALVTLHLLLQVTPSPTYIINIHPPINIINYNYILSILPLVYPWGIQLESLYWTVHRAERGMGAHGPDARVQPYGRCRRPGTAHVPVRARSADGGQTDDDGTNLLFSNFIHVFKNKK